MGENFANPLAELAEYTDMKRDLMNGYGPIHICGVTDSQKVQYLRRQLTEQGYQTCRYSQIQREYRQREHHQYL